MKLRKTRIKKTTKANGSVKYTAEYKWGFWWYEFEGHRPLESAERLGGGMILQAALGWFRNKQEGGGTEKEAKAFIDFYIRQVNHQNACNDENEVIKVEYEGYP